MLKLRSPFRKLYRRVVRCSATRGVPVTSYRPRLEILEDRLVPATLYTVNSLADPAGSNAG